MSVSKRLRYEIFRRDGHTCRYCGAKAPDAEVTVDHVIPVSLGGTDEPSNLVTACRDCNGGKTSSSPDAPLVTDVADKALEWAGAIKQAQAKMLADIQARERDREQFGEWWDGWKRVSGDTHTPIPKGPAWWVTIDQLLGAGLPLAALRECVDLAMTQKKVQDENRFRYMCGIAWNKVKTLQKTASAIAGGARMPDALTGAGGDTEDEDRELKLGRADLARELLSDLDAEELAKLQEEAREDWQAETPDEVDIASAHIAWNGLLIDLSWLASRTCDMLLATSDSVIQAAVRQARIELYDEKGPGFSRATFAEKVVHVAAMAFEEREATGYLASLPTRERMEWLAYTSAYLGHEAFLVTSAARFARAIKKGRGPFRNMCLGRGESIPTCPERATHWIRFNELECCQQEPEESHKGHRFCAKHRDMAVAGQQRHDGNAVTVMSWVTADEDEMAAPF